MFGCNQGQQTSSFSDRLQKNVTRMTLYRHTSPESLTNRNEIILATLPGMLVMMLGFSAIPRGLK